MNKMLILTTLIKYGVKLSKLTNKIQLTLMEETKFLAKNLKK